jgi:DNA-binding NarL/FixJ family response regulator
VIRVLIADDHHVVRAGLEQLLAAVEDMELVGAARDGREVVALAAGLAPDVVLMDLSMPEVDGTQATRQLLRANPDVRVVVLTSFSDRDRILAALEAGAVGYLLKDAEPEDLIRGIRAAGRGEAPLDPKAASTVLSERVRGAAIDLTDREQEVLRLLAAGMPNKLIASRLEITEKTVKAHLTSVYQRIGVSDRTQAALWAQRQGLA